VRFADAAGNNRFGGILLDKIIIVFCRCANFAIAKDVILA